jgi:hypothetical protein
VSYAFLSRLGLFLALKLDPRVSAQSRRTILEGQKAGRRRTDERATPAERRQARQGRRFFAVYFVLSLVLFAYGHRGPLAAAVVWWLIGFVKMASAVIPVYRRGRT